jgi:nitrate/nitrite transport system ATP-binding protein
MRILAATGATAVMVTHDVDEAVLLSDRIVMMTNGPAATIGKIVDVDLPRPRDRLALTSNARYHQLRGEALRYLHEAHAS